jgi:phenylacetate-CoA ligase
MLSRLEPLATCLGRPAWSPRHLRAYQLLRLQRLLRNAYDTVPFQRERLCAAGVKPEDVRRLADLEALPILRKHELTAVPLDARLSHRVRQSDLIRRRTSGSTGVPLEVVMTRRENAYHSLLSLRSEMLTGLFPWQRVAILGLPTFQQPGSPLPRLHLSSLDPPSKTLRSLRAYRPAALVGFVTSLRVLAEEIGTGALSIPRIYTTSEMLTTESRALIQAAFGGTVLSRYDAWETFVIGWECRPGGGLHLDADHLIVELVEGEVVVTNLDLYSTPFIRYALEDEASWRPGSCSCGCNFPRLEAVHGRRSEILTFSNGKRLDSLVLQFLAKQLLGAHRYQLVQTAPDRLRLDFVAGSDFQPESLERVRSSLEDVCAPGVVVLTRGVDTLACESSGKYRFVRSEFSDPKA